MQGVKAALFFDLHSHMLCGVDDGAPDREEMIAMLETAYADGVRAVCLTPHFSPYHFGDTAESSEQAFAELSAYAENAHPDMKLFLGHELGFYHGCEEALSSGRCRTLAGSRYLLVDFPRDVDFFEIQHALDRLSRSGYRPVLAHAECYFALHRKLSWLEEFAEGGGIIQLDADSACGANGTAVRKQFIRLIKRRLAHVVSSDAHNMTTRPPLISRCMPILNKYCDEEYIAFLVWQNAYDIVQDLPI